MGQAFFYKTAKESKLASVLAAPRISILKIAKSGVVEARRQDYP